MQKIMTCSSCLQKTLAKKYEGNFCANGIMRGGVCCDNTCGGQCGGSGCSKLDGKCCVKKIKKSKELCKDSSDTGCVLPGGKYDYRKNEIEDSVSDASASDSGSEDDSNSEGE